MLWLQVVTLDGGQLGYRQSIINFMSDSVETVHKLPRLPSQVKLLMYEKVDKKGNAKILHVRRQALQDYLKFFMQHNKLYKGVKDKAGQEVVPPVEEVEENWEHVPEDGPLKGVHIETASPTGKQGDADDAAAVENLESQPSTGTNADDDGLPSDADVSAAQWDAQLGEQPLVCCHLLTTNCCVLACRQDPHQQPHSDEMAQGWWSGGQGSGTWLQKQAQISDRVVEA